jgi:hypothetical protein
MSGTAEIVQHSSSLQPYEGGQPLTAKQLTARLALIHEVMRTVMKEGVDYGTIPGTPKPSLYKPGAEKLCVVFRMSVAKPVVEQVFDPFGDIRYRIEVPVNSNDGAPLTVGIGECSTGEEKYRWRRPVHPNEFDAAPEDRKRQKYQRDGKVWDQVRVEPADIANTVLKMAHKRAYIHAVIMATAAGSIFTQDIEDLPDGVAQDGNGEKKAPINPPQRKAAAPAGAGTTVRVKVTGIESKKGTNDKGPWEKWGIAASDGKKYGTFDAGHRQTAEDAQSAGLEVDVTYTTGKYGNDLQAITIVEGEPGADG